MKFIERITKNAYSNTSSITCLCVTNNSQKALKNILRGISDLILCGIKLLSPGAWQVSFRFHSCLVSFSGKRHPKFQDTQFIHGFISKYTVWHVLEIIKSFNKMNNVMYIFQTTPIKFEWNPKFQFDVKLSGEKQQKYLPLVVLINKFKISVKVAISINYNICLRVST